MEIHFKSAKELPSSFLETINGQLDLVWVRAASAFFARHVALNSQPSKQPKGVQAFINECLEDALPQFGWEGGDGRFVKDGIWLRFTFRNQMSLGSDFMDALLLAHRENVQALIIAAPSMEFARLITPKDVNSIVTYEKLEEYYARANSLFQIPLAIGRLEATGPLSPDIQRVLKSRL